ncbi:Oidioi.mRNA.OKI2018_I69.chr2.g5851.t1.cds [Oikopleura dioica]|uniref:Oidioi.mRNA.OKI2018_I69.chr2.g5851.t1.cds n=1 Tax=Oikopleura dioica TaxID=34765 RepID=A0ABN7T557_OIKDI|nr:Oidioi.mRNA.OKI2018_I69.chr2.g5851.t1.cds [Oikopleura dioica]
MGDKGRKRDNKELGQNDEETTVEKRVRTDTRRTPHAPQQPHLGQERPISMRPVPNLSHIVQPRPPREVDMTQVPVNQRIPRPPSGRYSDYFYMYGEEPTYGATDHIEDNWYYHIAVPRRDRRGPFARLFGRYALSVPVPRELRSFTPSQRLDMPKLEVYTMFIHFQNELTPIYAYIEYLNSFWQQQLFSLSKHCPPKEGSKKCGGAVNSRVRPLDSDGNIPIFVPRYLIEEFEETNRQLQSMIQDQRDMLSDIRAYLPLRWTPANGVELLRRLHECVAELELAVRRGRQRELQQERERENRRKSNSRKRKHGF